MSFTSLFSPLPRPTLQVQTIVAPTLRTNPPSTTPPLSVWISGLNTEFRKGTITAGQCRSPTPCSNSPSYSVPVPVPVPVSVLLNLDSDTIDFVLFPDVADADSPVPTYTRFYTYDFRWVQGYQIADILALIEQS